MVNKKIVKKEEVKTSNPKVKKTMLTLFLFLLPLLVIAFTQEFVTKVLLFFYEAILLKNFIEDTTKTTLD